MSITEATELQQIERRTLIEKAMLSHASATPLDAIIRRPGQWNDLSLAVLPEGRCQVECTGCYRTGRLVSERTSISKPLKCKECRRTEIHRDAWVSAEELRHSFGVLCRLGVDALGVAPEGQVGGVSLYLQADGQLTGTLYRHPRLLPTGARILLRRATQCLMNPLRWDEAEWLETSGHRADEVPYFLGYYWNIKNQETSHLYHGPDEI